MESEWIVGLGLQSVHKSLCVLCQLDIETKEYELCHVHRVVVISVRQ